MTIYDFEDIKKSININEYNEFLKNPWTRSDNRVWHYEIYDYINNQWIGNKYNILHRAQGKYLLNDNLVKIYKYLYIYNLDKYYLQFIKDNCHIFNLNKYGEIGCTQFINDYNQFNLEKIYDILIKNDVNLNKNILINIINYINSQIVLRKV